MAARPRDQDDVRHLDRIHGLAVMGQDCILQARGPAVVQ
jgi:hypothetical protein